MKLAGYLLYAGLRAGLVFFASWRPADPNSADNFVRYLDWQAAAKCDYPI